MERWNSLFCVFDWGCSVMLLRCWHQVDGQEGEGCGNNNHVRHVKGALALKCMANYK